MRAEHIMCHSPKDTELAYDPDCRKFPGRAKSNDDQPYLDLGIPTDDERDDLCY